MYTKITISGLIATGKTSLFLALQQKLNWNSFSASQFFRDYARINNLDLKLAEEQDSLITKKIDNKTEEFLKDKSKIIIEGWMAGIMADDYPNILKILLECDTETRILRFAEREKLTFKQAEKDVNKREQNLLSTLSKIYKRNDFVDPDNYNCIINTTNLNKDKVLKKVLDKLGKYAAQKT